MCRREGCGCGVDSRIVNNHFDIIILDCFRSDLW